jgi:hypothetical protein
LHKLRPFINIAILEAAASLNSSLTDAAVFERLGFLILRYEHIHQFLRNKQDMFRFLV